MKLFNLERTEDFTGVSGTGIVAKGVEFDDGACVVRWNGDNKTTVVHKDIESVKNIHCSHSGTRFYYTCSEEEFNYSKNENKTLHDNLYELSKTNVELKKQIQEYTMEQLKGTKLFTGLPEEK